MSTTPDRPGTDGTQPPVEPTLPQPPVEPTLPQPSAPGAVAPSTPEDVPPGAKPWEAPAATAKAPNPIVRILKLIAVPLLIGAAFFIWRGMGASAPEVGSCVKVDLGAGSAVNDLNEIACTDAGANFKVVGVVKNVSESTFKADTEGTTCQAYPTADYGVWEGRGNGYVLCLEEITK